MAGHKKDDDYSTDPGLPFMNQEGYDAVYATQEARRYFREAARYAMEARGHLVEMAATEAWRGDEHDNSGMTESSLFAVMEELTCMVNSANMGEDASQRALVKGQKVMSKRFRFDNPGKPAQQNPPRGCSC